jgi:hypothetical protein
MHLDHSEALRPVSHEEVTELLHGYAYEVLMEGAPEERYPQVAQHLAGCALCRDELNDMLEATRAIVESTAAPEPLNSRPDLSQLSRPWKQESSSERPWFIDRLGRLWMEFSQELLNAWAPSPLLGAVRGDLLYAYDSEEHQDEEAKTEQEAFEQVAVKIEIVAEKDMQTAQVYIAVDVPDQHTLDQAGIPVALYVEGHARRAKTDASGSVYFSHVPRAALASLNLEITVDQSA